ncbi:hypothetical protein C5167_001178 [Papaver somniferum]|uniref:Uncharacterized protein n=1 Tax=Papaver somniferum TaxID=3469 RepID=A0A4Y7KWA6_PAPSO|nr:hypothetical protein C5167_001178 [Papaver somniferum]
MNNFLREKKEGLPIMFSVCNKIKGRGRKCRRTNTRYLGARKATEVDACRVASAKLCISNLSTVTDKVCSAGLLESLKQFVFPLSVGYNLNT